MINLQFNIYGIIYVCTGSCTITGPLFENFDQMAHIFTTTQHRTLVSSPIDTRGIGFHSCIFFRAKLSISDMFNALSKLT